MLRIMNRIFVPTFFVFVLHILLFSATGLAQSGSLDTTFGNGGIAYVSGQLGSANSSAMQSDGKILVLSSNPGFGARVVRFNADGTVDEGFGTGGVVALYWPSKTSGQYGYARAIVLQNVGGTEKIVLAGYAGVPSKGKLVEGTRVDRLLPNGSIDTSFGNQGSVVFAGANATEQFAVNSVAIQSDQKIVLANSVALFRLNANGSTDSSFGSGGKVSSLISGSAITSQSDGRILIAGSTTSRKQTLAAVSRHNANGSVDTSFGSSGKVTANLGGGRFADVVAAQNGDIYAGGALINPSPGTIAAAAVRFTSSGQLDASFGSGGFVSFDSPGLNDYCWRIALQPDGKLLLAGNTLGGATADFLTVRFDTAGNLDYPFGTSGGSVIDLLGGNETARGVFVQNAGTSESPDYRIVLAGSGSAIGGIPQYSFAVRLNY